MDLLIRRWCWRGILPWREICLHSVIHFREC
jgi:hypothetical protein